MKAYFLLLTMCIAQSAVGHGRIESVSPASERHINFPDTASYQTLVVDLHTHSVFSDGHVWPSIRVAEALRDGLDAVAITEHLEWQPHLEDIPHPDRNRAYLQAIAAAAETPLLVIAGSEITRVAPAGHMNAVFISDANTLFRPPAMKQPFDAREYSTAANQWPAQEAVAEANRQGAFVFWNHPYWTAQSPDGIARISDFHRDNARNGLLHGIEIVNGDNYSEEAFAIALQHNLTLIGVSDVHNLIDWDYQPHLGGHRPVTLVLSTDRSEAAIKEALFDGRTVIWFKDLLIGRAEYLHPVIEASLAAGQASFMEKTDVLVFTLSNISDADLLLRNTSGYTFMDSGDIFLVPANSSRTLQVKPGKRAEQLDLDFEVLSALVAPKVHPVISVNISVAPSPPRGSAE